MKTPSSTHTVFEQFAATNSFYITDDLEGRVDESSLRAPESVVEPLPTPIVVDRDEGLPRVIFVARDNMANEQAAGSGDLTTWSSGKGHMFAIENVLASVGTAIVKNQASMVTMHLEDKKLILSRNLDVTVRFNRDGTCDVNVSGDQLDVCDAT